MKYKTESVVRMVIGSLGFETTIREGGSNLTVDMHAYGWRKEGFYPHVRKTGAAREGRHLFWICYATRILSRSLAASIGHTLGNVAAATARCQKQ